MQGRRSRSRLLYLLLTFCVEGVSVCVKKCRVGKENNGFEWEVNVLLKSYVAQILLTFLVFFCPYLIIFSPLITIITFKWNLFRLKKEKERKIKSVKFNNGESLLMKIHLILNAFSFVVGGYYYFVEMTHFYNVKCSNNSSETVMSYNPTSFCGPLKTYQSLSSVLTDRISDSKFFGILFGVLGQAGFIFVFLVVVICLLLWKNEYLKKLLKFSKKKEKEMSSFLGQLQEQLGRKDVINLMLMKIMRKKLYEEKY